MYQSNKAVFQTLRSIDSATFTGSYQVVGSSLTFSARILKIVNNSNVAVTVSYDGVNDNDFIPAGSFASYDFGTNKGTSSDALDLPKGTQVLVKGSAGSGSVYVVAISAFDSTMTIPL